jgi:hypothetical protein
MDSRLSIARQENEASSNGKIPGSFAGQSTMTGLMQGIVRTPLFFNMFT